MHLVYINPNATQAMTDGVVAIAGRALPRDRVTGMTNSDGPPAIEGPADGDAAIPGVLARVERAVEAGADAIVIACFDDTGLAEARALSPVPVLGIGQSAYTLAAMAGGRFSVVTSVDVAVPVIEGNIAAAGFKSACASVRASGVPVLTIDEGAEETRETLAAHIAQARISDGSATVILGCAGMAPLADDLRARTGVTLIDGVAASAHLAATAVRALRPVPDEAARIEEAKAVVETYLERSMVPDPEGAAEMTGAGFHVIFTGGRRFEDASGPPAFNAKRYAWVKKAKGRTDASYDAEAGAVRVFNTGHLYGAWPDGTPFEGNRYIDIFTVKDGRIIETQVWNDSAERLLDRHGLAETPL